MKPFIYFIPLIFVSNLYAAKFNRLASDTEAFGSPGAIPNWSNASKTHIGTSFEKGAKSPIWFTSSQGILTEVYYPTVDTAQIKDSQLLITDGKSFFVEEKNLNHKTEVIGPVEAHLVNSDSKNRFTITHNLFTDPNSGTVIDEMKIKAEVDGLKFYLLTNPHINNTGFKDLALVDDKGFTVREGQTQLKIRALPGFKKKSVGFVGSSDGFQDISKDFIMNNNFLTATNGHTATTGELNIPDTKGEYTVYIQYSFSNLYDGQILKAEDYVLIKENYFKTWDEYFRNLKVPSNLSHDEEQLYLRSLFTLKCHEDKLNKGAVIASISIPWGESQFESNDQQIGGYHLIWPRDLYNIATSLLASGDRETATNALRFLKKIQFKDSDRVWNLFPRVIEKKGAFPQNVWVNGKTYWEGFQVDQTAYPVLLFYNLYLAADEKEKSKLINEFQPMIKDALSFLLKYGPWTQQERWEENFGISPSSFASVAAAMIAGSKIYHDDFGYKLKNAVTWWLTRSNDNIETWTYTTNGVYGNGQYYLRIAGGSSFDAIWDPNSNASTHIANSSMKVDQRKILDQGFLQLSLLGLKSGNDYKIKNSKEIVDNNISVITPNGRGYYRYSFDAYGENQKGRLWPLLSGEHARFYIERFSANDLNWASALSEVNQILDSMYKFANDGLMIPEQVYEKSGEGTGSATPLAWSHAEYIKVLWSRELQRNIENVLIN